MTAAKWSPPPEVEEDMEEDDDAEVEEGTEEEEEEENNEDSRVDWSTIILTPAWEWLMNCAYGILHLHNIKRPAWPDRWMGDEDMSLFINMW